MTMVKAEDRRGQEHRCDCGNLLLVMTPEGLEVKCKRCKRIKLIPIAAVG